MNKLIHNPFTKFFISGVHSWLQELKNKGKHLSIGSMSFAKSCVFGTYVTVYQYVFLEHSTIGDYTYISNNSHIANSEIGKFCSIGPHVQMGLGNHPTDTFVSTHPAFFSTKKQAQIAFTDIDLFEETKKTHIGNDVWVGANAILIDGVSIGDGAIIAAGAVVTKDVPPYTIVGGIPAKTIKKRFSEDQINQLLTIQWWNKDPKWIKRNALRFQSIDTFLKFQSID